MLFFQLSFYTSSNSLIDFFNIIFSYKMNNKKVRIVGVKHTPNTFTDFEIMMHHEDYKNALFIFEDNETEKQTQRRGPNNATIRHYNIHNKQLSRPLSFGIPVANYRNGYQTFEEGINIVNNACLELKRIFEEGGYDTIVYSIENLNSPLIDTTPFIVNNDIKRYITRYFLCLFPGDYVNFSKDGYGEIKPITAEMVNII